jgi:hypothetical protein
VYTKKRGDQPDLQDPLVIKQEASMEAVVRLAFPFLSLSSLQVFAHLLPFVFVQCDSIHKGIRHKVRFPLALHPSNLGAELVLPSSSLQFKYAVVWGKSSKFAPAPQKVGLTHQCAQDDGALLLFPLHPATELTSLTIFSPLYLLLSILLLSTPNSRLDRYEGVEQQCTYFQQQWFSLFLRGKEGEERIRRQLRNSRLSRLSS